MKINAIELYHVSIPLKETFQPAWIPGYPQTHNRFTLLKIVTDEGSEDYSAGVAMGKERAGLGDLLGGYLIGADPTDIERIQSLLKQAGFLGWLVSIVDRVPPWDLDRAKSFAAGCHINDIKWLQESLYLRDYKERLFSPHTWTNGIGFYINWNMALADKNNQLPLEYPLEEPSWIPEIREGFIDPIIPHTNGILQPFSRPGLGFEINENLLRKYGKRFFKLTATRLKLKVIREKGLKAALELKRRKEGHK